MIVPSSMISDDYAVAATTKPEANIIIAPVLKNARLSWPGEDNQVYLPGTIEQLFVTPDGQYAVVAGGFPDANLDIIPFNNNIPGNWPGVAS